MNTQFKESFTKDLRKIRDQDLLNRAKAAIESVEQAQSLGEILDLERLKGNTAKVAVNQSTHQRWSDSLVIGVLRSTIATFALLH